MSHNKSTEELKIWLQTYSAYINTDDLKNCLLYENNASRLNKIASQVYQHLQTLPSKSGTSVTNPPTVRSDDVHKPKVISDKLTSSDNDNVLQIISEQTDTASSVNNEVIMSIVKKINCGKINFDILQLRDTESIVNYLNSVNLLTSEDASYILRNKKVLHVESVLRRALQSCLDSKTSVNQPKSTTHFLHNPLVWQHVNSIKTKYIRQGVMKIFSSPNKILPTKKNVLHSLRLLLFSIKTKRTPPGIVSYISKVLEAIVAYITNSKYTNLNLSNDVVTIEKLIVTIEKHDG